MRADKKGRIVKSCRWRRRRPSTPARCSSAPRCCSIATGRRRSSKMAFATPDIKGKEIQIAAAFHVTRGPEGRSAACRRCSPRSSPTTAPTCWRPPMRRPSRTMPRPRPSRRCCKDDTADSGRFIPPMAKGDHDWVSSPLPPASFSAREQQCLAAGIYFEARGESVKGQAAVAQVVLNRVRNPAYPKIDLRRRLPERQLAQPLPVLLCLRRHQGPRRQPRALRDGRRRSRMAVTAGKICHSRGRLVDPLPRDLCQPALGAHHGEDEARSACTSSTAPMAAAGAEPSDRAAPRFGPMPTASPATACRTFTSS